LEQREGELLHPVAEDWREKRPWEATEATEAAEVRGRRESRDDDSRDRRSIFAQCLILLLLLAAAGLCLFTLLL
jgi:hypothetical protein